MSKDKEWLKKEIAVDLDNLCWNGKLSNRDTKNIKDRLKCLVDQLDEPEKVVIPQFVGEWFEHNENRLGDAIYWLCVENQSIISNQRDVKKRSEMTRWFYENDNCIEILMDIKKGYTIEQPKLLTVIVKDYDKTIMRKQLPEDEVNKMMEGLE